MSTELTIFLAAFVILVILGAPIYLSLLVSSMIYFLFNPQISAMMIMQKLYGCLDSFVLLAIPLFMFAGNIMNSGGITDRIFNFAKAVTGHRRGGLGYVNVIASLIFSGMSGSAMADVGGLGKIEMKAMEDAGYDKNFTLGITAASATMGPIIPPSIPMVIFGAYASVSVGALFLGGIIPGLLMAVILCGWTAYIAKKKNFPVSEKYGFTGMLRAFWKALFALLMPVIIMGAIWTGAVTPTEAAALGIMYASIINFLIYREMKFRDLLLAAKEAVISLAPTMLVVIASVLFGWVLQFERMDKLLVTIITSFTGSKYVVLLLINLILLFFGCILDATPVIMLLVPMIMPLASAYGIDSVHIGVVVVLNLMIGLMTPPIGGTLNILSGVTKTSYEDVVKATSPWLIPLVIVLILITYIPALVTCLPHLLGLGG